MGFLKKYIADKDYYRDILRVGIPLALTMLLQSCMSIVDSIMVSSIGMVTAVGNASNVLMLHEGINWGIISGIAVFASQFFGAGQEDNMSRTMGLCLLFTLGNSLLWVLVAYLFGESVLAFYLNDPDVLANSLIYLRITVLSLIPGALNHTFTTMYKAMHNTRLPFVMSTGTAVLNIILNYYLIYIRKIGVAGAAYGTLISACASAVIYFVIAFKTRPIFFRSFREIFDIHAGFVKPVIITFTPIIINETLFGFGSSLFNKAFGLLGTQPMDAYYVANQIFNLFLFAVWGFGGAASIMVGTTLGKGEIQRAQQEAKYQLGIGFGLGSFLSVIMVAFSPLFLHFFTIADTGTYAMAKSILYVFALKIFIRTFTYMMFSTLKAGGDSRIINLYDSGFMYLIGVPLAFLSVYLGVKNIAMVILITQIEQLVRFVFTLRRYNSNVWARDLTVLVE